MRAVCSATGKIAKHKPSHLLITLSLPVMHARDTSRNQQCRNTHTAAQNQLGKSGDRYADHHIPILKCCIISTTLPVRLTRTSFSRTMNIELNGFVFVCTLLQVDVIQLMECMFVSQNQPAKSRCRRDGHCHCQRGSH